MFGLFLRNRKTFKLFNEEQFIKSAFHSTKYLEKKRTGSSAWEARPRPFSKKQKKRFGEAKRIKSSTVDHSKVKVKQKQVETFWESKETQEYIEKTRTM
jgi:hypothetical protein